MDKPEQLGDSENDQDLSKKEQIQSVPVIEKGSKDERDASTSRRVEPDVVE